MEENRGATQSEVRRELEGKFSPPVLEEFQKAWGPVSSTLNKAELALWARAGLDLAGQGARSWEAACRYFKASPAIVGLMPFNHFVKWVDCGTSLCRESPTLAVSYFDSSPKTMARLRSRYIESWANLGRSLYKGNWKSSTLSAKFFQASPALLRDLTVPELAQFVTFLDVVSRRSYDLAAECMALADRIFPLLGDRKEPFISLATRHAESNWRQVKGLFEATIRALPGIAPGERLRLLKLAESLQKNGRANIPATMLEVSQSLAQLDRENHGRLLELAEVLLKVSPPAMPAFIRSCPMTLERVTMLQLERWFEVGLGDLKQNGDKGLAYFRGESAHSQEVLETLSSSVEFQRIQAVMELYCQALSGEDVKLGPAGELVEKSIGWVSSEAPTTEGSTVYVPSRVDRYPTKEENFAWFKVVSTHQVAHLEFGSFRFEFDRPSTRFRDLRPELDLIGSGSGEEGASDRGWVTSLHRFFGLFEDRSLALDVFTAVEDGRLDARVGAEYRGIRSSYLKVQRDSISKRPQADTLPTREVMVELLVRLSLQQHRGLPAPAGHLAEARKIASMARRVMATSATVEDSAEATLRIYAILASIPNVEAPTDVESIDLDEGIEYEGTDDQTLLQQLAEGVGREPLSEEERDYRSSQDVEFRGEFKPQLVQLLEQLRLQSDEQEGEGAGQPITQEMLEELMRSSAEMDSEAHYGDAQQQGTVLANNILKEVGLELPQGPDHRQGPMVHMEEDGGSLEPSEPQSFVYDEWDFRAEDYKPRWCIVRQKSMAEGDAAFYRSTLHGYAPLVEQIRRQFELMVPEMFRKVRRLEDGEDIDLDSLVEAFVDIRTGVSPTDKLYWRRNKVQRDVAVVFLLDTSASTAEAIEDSRNVADDWEAPDDPAEYLTWLRARRGQGIRRSYKRIIDLEKEAVVLLINALEAIGDIYGIYGFSGYGRENVEFYTIKDIDEQFSDSVKGRIDRIAPLHATRMGPAIRHATTKLEAQDARTKLLFLISDGRPQDRGYSREGVEKEYAVHDTKMALDEAKSKEITAFCLTVDKSGHDYLKGMCQDIGYEVLDDIYELPRRLLYLYKGLTM